MNDVRICILVADKLDEMQVIVPYDLWKRANFIVELISIEKKNTIVLQKGIKISCNASIDKTNLTQYNAIYMPGGIGYTKYTHPKTNPKLKSHLTKDFQNQSNKWILANCSAPVVLFEWNLQNDNKMACSKDFKDLISPNYSPETIVSSGNLITGNGTGSIMEFSLKVIDVLSNKEISDNICENINYNRIVSLAKNI